MVKHKQHARVPVGGEPQFVDTLRRRAHVPRGSSIVLGIGDDCAIVRPRGSAEDLLFTTDLLIEGAHFLRDTHRPEDAGWKALARGLSDIAAMGGTPRFCLVSLALTRDIPSRWVDRFYDGLLELSASAGAPLVGGDVAVTDRVMCDIVVSGAVPRGTALRRDRARPGDAIYVSGQLGVSALGLATRRGAAWRRHKRPEPRLALGRFLRQQIGARAAMDLSDGISLDLHRMCTASGLQAEISMPPIYRGASREQALHGGEDYELLFTTPAAACVPAEFEGIPLTRIGTMRRGTPGRVLLDGAELPPGGWDHLR